MTANLDASTKQSKIIKNVLRKSGLGKAKPIAASLQGSIWTAKGDNGEQYIVKVTNKHLHQHSVAEIDGAHYAIQENIKLEAQILSHLTAAVGEEQQDPHHIVKFVDFFQSQSNYYLVMENGGSPLFEFVVKAHQLIAVQKLEIREWHKCVKVIYKQLLDAMQYMHAQGIVHYDISLENMVINDVEVVEDSKTGKIKFITDHITIKLIDFGLADICGVGEAGYFDCTSTKFVGKEIYKSPEVQRQQDAFDAMANDVFCSGVCLYMMVLGTLPWKKASMTDKVFARMMKHGMLHMIHSW
eukprot:CAMPEP_0202685690 /NCGR_PEP_ID=MMETSP1385-20130828/1521_1 /ASSEMBLY_ACC=CAM_ASM_000861 /TAXON_ID=933848 /ORGANISM="Elphidium margaritaceum" /LENGTH=297 /DNA_ID=CAMNT_0049340113 /DNA_START=62 /DNA_END=952 /DNA_ORIENTATION=+